MKILIRRIIILLLIIAVFYQFICIKKLGQKVEGFFNKVFETIESKPDFEKYKQATVEIKVGKPGGAGVIVQIDKDYLYILTAKHMFKSKSKIIIQLNTINGKKIKIEDIDKKNIYQDNKVDLALIKLPKPEGEFVYLPISEHPVKQGDKIFTIGHPLNFHYTITEGVVSNFVKRHHNNKEVEYMMISAPSFAGNSGGACVNTRGELLGIVIGIMYVNKPEGFSQYTLYLYHMTFVVKIEDLNRLLKEAGND